MLRLRATLSNVISRSMALKVGDTLPNTVVHSKGPGNNVNLHDVFENKKGLLIGVVAAFSGTCQNDQIPTFLSHYDQIKAKGIDKIACISVNDAFVMDGWGKAMNVGDKIDMLADFKGDFAKASGFALDTEGVLGSKRIRRFLMLVDNGKIKQLHLEEDPAKATITNASDALKWL